MKAYKTGRSDDLAKEIAKDLQGSMKGGKTADEAIAGIIAKYGKYGPKEPKADGDAGAPAVETFSADKDPTRPQLLTSSAFNRGGDPIPAISAEATESIVKFAFEDKPNDVAPDPVKTDDGYIVVQLKEHKAATKEEFDKERDTYEVGMLSAKQSEALANYVHRLRETSKAEIKIDDKNLFGTKSDAGPPRDDEEE